MAAFQSDEFSYLDRPLRFKIQKALRYVALDGIRKTLGKVRAQYHCARTADFSGERWNNPSCRNPDLPERFVGIIGCGKFAHSMVCFYLRQKQPHFLRAAYDTSKARARSLVDDYAGAFAAGTPEQILADPAIRLVYIASNHGSHADYAIRCLDAGKSVHIEKPQVVSEEQLDRLLAAQKRNAGCMVFLGFNRPSSPHFRKIKAVFDSQPGAAMINWFVAGHYIPDDHWYFAPEEGGRVIGNLCHWTDATLALLGCDKAFPCEIIPVCAQGSKSDFSIGMKFHDGSIAAITFSAKGQSFEGIHEKLNLHRGDALMSLSDFKRTDFEISDYKTTFRTYHRDHGHGQNILNSFEAVRSGDRRGSVDARYNEATAKLFLGAKAAIDGGRAVRVAID